MPGKSAAELAQCQVVLLLEPTPYQFARRIVQLRLRSCMMLGLQTAGLMPLNAEKYDWMTNSSGQDNLSQILFALLSFKNLKRENGKTFKGGLLVIDELEATFHPKAQDKIIKLLIKEAKTTGFQVIFTTHSLTAIEFFTRKVRSNDGNIIYHYFTKANSNLEIEMNKPIHEIRNDLFMSLIEVEQPQKITVYAEDDECRWLLRKLIKGYAKKIYLPKVRIGCQSLIDLMNLEKSFTDYFVIFDGDLKEKDIKRIKKINGTLRFFPETERSLRKC